MYRHEHEYKAMTNVLVRQCGSPSEMTILEGLREADVPLLLSQDTCVLQHPSGSVMPGLHPVHAQVHKVGPQVLGILSQRTTIQRGATSLQQQQCIKSLQ